VRTIAISGAIAVALVASGVAFATWVATGEGTGPVSTAAAPQALGVQVAPVSGLYPGDTVQTDVTLSNPNPYPISLSSLTATPDHPECYSAAADGVQNGTETDIVIKREQDSSSPGAVASPGTAVVVLDVSMPLNAPPSCEGQQFTVTVDASGGVGD
jgi:hypothetical protein